MTKAFTKNEVELLGDPAISIPMMGKVFDQSTGDSVLLDPTAITHTLQNTILSYVSNPPRDEFGMARWLTVLKPRQAGASTTAALAFYPRAAYVGGWNHITIADNRERADGLHERIMYCHAEWPEELRSPQKMVTESRNLSFENFSKMRVLSGHSEAVGIGRSVSSMLASEVAFWANAGQQFSMILPSMQNRKNALMLLECTPATLDAPSAEWWRDKCDDASAGRGRDLYCFVPFWDGKLNARPWRKGDRMDNEEIRLMDKYGPAGLELDNLAFRRFVMDSDPQIRRNHELFSVFFPFDDITCWIASGSSAIPPHVMARHALSHSKERKVKFVLDDGQVVEYEQMEPPRADALYVIGVDPAGYGARDHCAFQVLELWNDEWRQVASFGDVMDPSTFEKMLFKVGILYNQAMIAVERNGVGIACVELLKRDGYPRIYFDHKFKGGIHKASHDAFMAVLLDKLLDKLVILGSVTYKHLCSYKSDKAIERSMTAEIMKPDPDGGKRRPRHHWDRVSALMIACIAAETAGIRFRRQEVDRTNVVLFQDMTFSQIEAYKAQIEATSGEKKENRARYTRKKRS